jgi:hypothetical protein
MNLEIMMIEEVNICNQKFFVNLLVINKNIHKRIKGFGHNKKRVNSLVFKFTLFIFRMTKKKKKKHIFCTHSKC